ncbi:MAG: NUDIX domain-containing protein [Pseudanabaena sp. M109S1SP1A06QC]|nr:NUDIX domain-containing protein [Pseudanabaena sp. M109S1SP1A06QC]
MLKLKTDKKVSRKKFTMIFTPQEGVNKIGSSGFEGEMVYIRYNCWRHDTPITLAQKGFWILLALLIPMNPEEPDNFIFGYVETGETPINTVIKATQEEAGVEINNIVQMGYILAEKKVETSSNKKHPKVSTINTAINIYHSFVTSVSSNWNKQETQHRQVLNSKNTKKILSKRNDNNQLVQILDYVAEYVKKLILKIEFEFKKKAYNPTLPSSQVFNFTKNKEGMYCIVRDFNEQHFSLPGGGCDLGESWENCSIRETLEETQMETSNTKIIGVYVLSYMAQTGALHQVQHIRTLSNCDETIEFIPR